MIREGPKAVGDGEENGEAPDGVTSSCISAACLYVPFAGICAVFYVLTYLQIGLFRACMVGRV